MVSECFRNLRAHPVHEPSSPSLMEYPASFEARMNEILSNDKVAAYFQTLDLDVHEAGLSGFHFHKVNLSAKTQNQTLVRFTVLVDAKCQQAFPFALV